MRYNGAIVCLCGAALLGTATPATAAIIQLLCVQYDPSCSNCVQWSLTLDTTNATASWIVPNKGMQERGQRITVPLPVSPSEYSWSDTLHNSSNGSMFTESDRLNRGTRQIYEVTSDQTNCSRIAYSTCPQAAAPNAMQ